MCDSNVFLNWSIQIISIILMFRGKGWITSAGCAFRSLCCDGRQMARRSDSLAICTCICTPLMGPPPLVHQPPNPTSGVGDVKTHCDISCCPASWPAFTPSLKACFLARTWTRSRLKDHPVNRHGRVRRSLAGTSIDFPNLYEAGCFWSKRKLPLSSTSTRLSTKILRHILFSLFCIGNK